ncbi:MAG: hypothetical protein ACTSRF_13510, partial [Candidatus Freyarchaeota archaeon]
MHNRPVLVNNPHAEPNPAVKTLIEVVHHAQTDVHNITRIIPIGVRNNPNTVRVPLTEPVQRVHKDLQASLTNRVEQHRHVMQSPVHKVRVTRKACVKAQKIVVPPGRI